MKRFGWLWSAIAGAIVLPLLMSLCGRLYFFSLLSFTPDFLFGKFSALTSNFAGIVLRACVGAILGANTWALWNRSSPARIAGTVVGFVATAVAFVSLWRRLETPVPRPVGQGWFFLDLKQEFILLFCQLAPRFCGRGSCFSRRFACGRCPKIQHENWR